MILRIDLDNPDKNRIEKAVQIFAKGGIIVFPTDTVYAMGCKAGDKVALEKLCRLKNTDLKRSNFSVIVKDFMQLSNYVLPLSTSQFRFMNKALPGPYTFILQASKNAEKIFNFPKKTIGVRMPGIPILNELIDQLKLPLITTSIHDDNVEWEFYLKDPADIHDLFEDKIDLVIDGGMGEQVPSTIVDATSDELVLVRKGKGDAFS